MQLKQYQTKVNDTLQGFLKVLSRWRDDVRAMAAINQDMACAIDFPQQAWFEFRRTNIGYHPKTTGLGDRLPNACLKVPTGGGKTLLACHAIDHICKLYLRQQNGLVLWIVPSNQIYKQTLAQLKNRHHPYRQVLDIANGSRTLVREKGDVFTKQDVQENLVVLLLMLPSANRLDKATLKMFQDSGGFTDFFPPEDDYLAQKALIEAVPNLDKYGEGLQLGIMGGLQIKTSLGNALRLARPIIVLDEGHKAYSAGSVSTLMGFNPSFMLELSATPNANANKLVETTGRELNEEEMIKLDIHLINKATSDWKSTLLVAIEKRNDLEKEAENHFANSGTYIRPIMLIQVERTGADQRGNGYIHAEEVREYLLRNCRISAEQIAVKSSATDDIEGIDLLSPDTQIRYIITKQALQEGWDCPFAYVLTILANPQSATGLTQLIGRVLRQPHAKKTGVAALDECYVYTFQRNAANLVHAIKGDLEKEGLGDITNRISMDEGGNGQLAIVERTVRYREQFRQFEGNIYMPQFVVQEAKSWRKLSYEADILSRIDYNTMDLQPIIRLSLAAGGSQEQMILLNIAAGAANRIETVSQENAVGSTRIDTAFLAQQLCEIVPNPFVSQVLGREILAGLRAKYAETIISSNFIYIIEEAKKHLLAERDRLAEAVFKRLILDNTLCFFLLHDTGFVLPDRIKIKSARNLVRVDNTAIANSLFDVEPEEGLNEVEKSVAIYLDNQQQFLWWYRNISRQGFHIQGWKRGKIFPDFIVGKKSTSKENAYDKVYVLETKGLHLNNEDTAYKQNVFELCTKMAVETTWQAIEAQFTNKNFEFQVIFSNEWQNRINQLA